MINTAIVGGGVAGAYCASCLAEHGIYPTIFDSSHPREKPCGGLVSTSTLRIFPFIKQIPVEHKKIKKMNIVSPKGNKIEIRPKEESMGFSRQLFDKYLVDIALKKGAKLIQEKVVALERKGDLWYLKTKKQTYKYKIIIGADGVNSLVRKNLIGHLDKKDIGLCFGYFTDEPKSEEMVTVFSPYRRGYMWIIPRGRNTCFGIGASQILDSNLLKKELDIFIKKNYPRVRKLFSWIALIPIIKDTRVFNAPLAGKNWMLIGDAAGHVNPISGEGILYALLDGQLAAEAIAENSPIEYDGLWKKAYGINLFSSIKISNWLYKKPVLEVYCQTLRHSFMQLPLKTSIF